MSSGARNAERGGPKTFRAIPHAFRRSAHLSFSHSRNARRNSFGSILIRFLCKTALKRSHLPRPQLAACRNLPQEQRLAGRARAQAGSSSAQNGPGRNQARSSNAVAADTSHLRGDSNENREVRTPPRRSERRDLSRCRSGQPDLQRMCVPPPRGGREGPRGRMDALFLRNLLDDDVLALFYFLASPETPVI